MAQTRKERFDLARAMARQVVERMAGEHAALLGHDTVVLDGTEGIGDGWACRQCDPDLFAVLDQQGGE